MQEKAITEESAMLNKAETQEMADAPERADRTSGRRRVLQQVWYAARISGGLAFQNLPTQPQMIALMAVPTTCRLAPSAYLRPEDVIKGKSSKY